MKAVTYVTTENSKPKKKDIERLVRSRERIHTHPVPAAPIFSSRTIVVIMYPKLWIKIR